MDLTQGELGPQATTITQVILRRALAGMVPEHTQLIRPGLPPATVHADELPPMSTVSRYRVSRGNGQKFP